jgi:protein YIPF1/2
VNNDTENGGARRRTTSWIFSLVFWQQYFDVDTEDVVDRIKNAIGSPLSGTFGSVIGENPDLWGPFWVCATLIFLNALGSKYVNYLMHDDATGDFNFDVNRISYGVVMFYGYTFCVPLGLWCVLRCFGGVNTGLAALLCVYGYSLMVYIPMGVACLVPMETVRWAAFLPSMVISSTFLFFNVRGVVAESPKGLAFTTPFMGCVVGAHAVFGLLLKVYWVS